MGKKKVAGQSAEEVIKETESREAAEKKASQETVLKDKKGKIRQLNRGKVYIKSSYNNTIITLTDMKNNVLVWSSAGSVGFKGPKKATPYAATRVVETILEKLKGVGLREVSIFVKGVGSGRESAIRALVNQGLDVNLIKDVTPVPHNGCRKPKPRRV